MDNNHQKFDSQSIANRVRELFLHYGIGKRQHARELSRILDLSFSHAHRKLKGQSPWTLEQINSVAAALGETPAAIADLSAEHETTEPNMARDAIFFVAGVAMPCVGHIGDELAKYLGGCGFNAVAFYDVDSFCQALQQSLFDGYVVDWLIGEETADRCIATIRASDNPDAPVLVLTGELGTDRRESEIAQAMREYDVLGPYEKPVRLHVIEAALQRCFNL
ncbi:helix-turn-helix domain-containing protein [Serratia marcescens]|uniref:helix-turn-helix domain-containing protein n=1 Tax=Serratia marcescens TaxID=615 RepID=UPI0013770847|nr:helix-turn-helix domain-containing protein [Serratia marcescens]NCI55852.1 histidine kinase [Serratia marcescens]NDJ08182.1 histidine kinase [Serratia marcescens]NDJ30845.1 histidine kinase [Serratia marcescens]NDJ45064.1 histidine kinase [Serratia marcescens]NDJ49606.1 histidine kinase [Serratia marcescens]